MISAERKARIAEQRAIIEQFADPQGAADACNRIYEVLIDQLNREMTPHNAATGFLTLSLLGGAMIRTAAAAMAMESGLARPLCMEIATDLTLEPPTIIDIMTSDQMENK